MKRIVRLCVGSLVFGFALLFVAGFSSAHAGADAIASQSAEVD